MSMVESRSCVQREGVYRWFSSLTSAERAEFLCGLLDLSNNPADLSGLTHITDEVVRSKLLVSLALLSSGNREAAGVLYRTLTHIDSVINNYGLALNDGRTEEQFLLLFTMALTTLPSASTRSRKLLGIELAGVSLSLITPSLHLTAPLPPAASPLPDASAASLPLSACPPCHTTLQLLPQGRGNTQDLVGYVHIYQ
ncbi:hypothetical protein KUCAC02_021733 [Chaenocephalus aceratus]|uniref:Uncharacterized protein n=1 Tax=Chaenocephalus aceratus TaxID=36190 RepID=A0ACB9XGA1_CHAAC|nr:hypothetical protein KUCAC02_021733 [Chaenocephalus aceratus]